MFRRERSIWQRLEKCDGFGPLSVHAQGTWPSKGKEDPLDVGRKATRSQVAPALRAVKSLSEASLERPVISGLSVLSATVTQGSDTERPAAPSWLTVKGRAAAQLPGPCRHRENLGSRRRGSCGPRRQLPLSLPLIVGLLGCSPPK